MKFSRLKLHGFKSFADLTELYFEPGLTGIVGPNGCGKSNLVEALRWVMGESSYKAMRASGMDDVIFSGSAGRPARNSAEVTVAIDNTGRTAPAALNHADLLEVTRRITREEGSVYRVNGREVRARDVQLLFADASTGAHSPALVRQGQIGELIAARPQQRRALLEEAAGISGLHSRRHEAELRLRAAEQNLERVDDVIAQVTQQLEQLQRQARLATRYRSLSGDIRRAEAALFHLRWHAAREAEAASEVEQKRQVAALAEAQHLELEAQKLAFLTENALQPRRDAEAAAGAALQRLTIAAEQLAEEIRRGENRRRELAERLAQAASDAARERDLLAEGEVTRAALAGERLTHFAAATAAADALAAAEIEAAETRATAQATEAEARAAAADDAQLRARHAAAERRVDEIEQRRARLSLQLIEATRAREALDLGDGTATRRETVVAAQQRAEADEALALAAEEAARAAQAALDAARPGMQAIEATITRLDAEAKTLIRVLEQGAASRGAPVGDALVVAAGLEAALGAALGDDLEASVDPGAALHWTGPFAAIGDSPLPDGVEALTRYVSGSPLLARRLTQVGVVSQADGARLHPLLRPGQRLVTRAGDLWRWDGFVAAAAAPSHAAQRLARRNRLAEVEAELAEQHARRDTLGAELAVLDKGLATARADEHDARESWRAAARDIALAQRALDEAIRAAGALAAKAAALDEARKRLGADLIEVEAASLAARQALAGSAQIEAAAAALADKHAATERARSAADDARLRLAALEGAARARAGRLEQIERDEAVWERRCQDAREQIVRLEARAAEFEAERAALKVTPQDHETRRTVLDADIARARAMHAAGRRRFGQGPSRSSRRRQGAAAGRRGTVGRTRRAGAPRGAA